MFCNRNNDKIKASICPFGIAILKLKKEENGYEKNTKNTVNLTLTNSTNQTWKGKLNRKNVSWVSEKTDETTGEVTCTTYTIVVRISCIAAVQCFDPINCETLCNQLI